MPTTQQRLSAAITFFFDKALPAATGKRFTDLTDPLVHRGSYALHTGGPVETPLRSVPVAYALRVAATPLAVTGGLPVLGTATSGGATETRHLLWIRQVADIAVDTEQEIARVLADLDSFAGLFEEAAASTGAPATGGSAPPPVTTGAAPGALPRATEWARVLATPAVRAALGNSPLSLTEVPAPLRGLTTDLTDLKAILLHFFTFKDNGEHYTRWSGAGRDPANAEHLTPAYKEENVREVQLERHQIYVYAVVPESLLNRLGDASSATDATTVFREVVIRFDETGNADIPFSLKTVHTARWLRPAAPHEDFVFFYTDEGLGIQATAEVRNKLTAQMRQFLQGLAGAGDRRDVFLARNAHLITPASAGVLVHVLTSFSGAPTLPAGVIDSGGSRPTRSLLVPPEKILEVAALPQVTTMTVPFPGSPSNAEARTQTRFGEFVATLPPAAQGGAGVLVGVIDSGIDGSHRAFLDAAGATRIVAVWDNGPAAPLVAALAAAGRPALTPALAHPGNAAYASMTSGIELSGADVGMSVDLDGHGTHVAGTAAGREVPDPANPATPLMPAGFAPNAKLAIVRMIDDGVPQDMDQAILWIFEKARELDLPCVINMSFGHTDHPHDGTDDQSVNFLSHVTDTTTNTYLPGRILVGAAGNDRAKNRHVRRLIPAGARQNIVMQLARVEGDVRVTAWIKNPGGGAGPHAIDVTVSGRGLRRNTATSTTQTVRFGGSTHADFPAHRTSVDINSSHDPKNNDLLFTFDFSTTNPAVGAMLEEQWTISIVNHTGSRIDFHAWVSRRRRSGTIFMSATERDDDAFLVDSPAVGPAVVSVAATVSKMAWTDSTGTAQQDVTQRQLEEIATFSSPGPLRFASVQPEQFYRTIVHHEINGVDVAAPGFRIQSALSSTISAANAPAASDIITPISFLLQGTSMACPVVTGLVANLLGANRNLTLPDVLDRLKRSSAIPAASNFQVNPGGGEPDGTPPGHPGYSRDWGYGLVNAKALLVP